VVRDKIAKKGFKKAAKTFEEKCQKLLCSMGVEVAIYSIVVNGSGY
jgi:hypothetical protein